MTSFEVWRRLQRHQTVRPLPSRRRDWREAARKSLLVIVVLLVASGSLAALAGGIYKGLRHSSFFQITGIKIEGCRRITKEMVLDLSGIDIHSNLLALDLQAVQSRIQEHGWVEQVRIDRHWPNELAITIRERTPVALINLADGLHYLDQRGVIFARVQAPDDLDFPVITGIDGRAPAEIEGAVEEALRFLISSSRGNPALPKQNISELHIEEDGGLTLFLVDRPSPIHLGRGEMATKYSRLARVLTWLYRTGAFSEFAYIRLDYDASKVLVGTGRAG